MNNELICVTPECGEELSPRSRLKHCVNCRASMGMWRRRGIRAILVRRSKLKKYDSRMETLVDQKIDKKVVVLHQRRKTGTK